MAIMIQGKFALNTPFQICSILFVLREMGIRKDQETK